MRPESTWIRLESRFFTRFTGISGLLALDHNGQRAVALRTNSNGGELSINNDKGHAVVILGTTAGFLRDAGCGALFLLNDKGEDRAALVAQSNGAYVSVSNKKQAAASLAAHGMGGMLEIRNDKGLVGLLMPDPNGGGMLTIFNDKGLAGARISTDSNSGQFSTYNAKGQQTGELP